MDALGLARGLERQSILEAGLVEYERFRLWHIRLYQAASYLFTPAYQSDSTLVAGLRDWLMAPLSRVPPAPQVLAALVAGAWGAPLNAINPRLLHSGAPRSGAEDLDAKHPNIVRSVRAPGSANAAMLADDDVRDR